MKWNNQFKNTNKALFQNNPIKIVHLENILI